QLSTVSNTVPSTAKLNPEKGQFTAEELLRLEATKIERMSCLRSRTRWLPEEDRRLLDLAERYQRKWTYLTRFFVDRPAANLCNRYKMLINEIKLGGWSKEELEELQNFGNGRSYDEIDDWEKLKESPLFHNRPLSMVKATYKHSFDPRIHKGRWTREESDKLEKYVAMFGEDEMDKIAQFIGTRTKRQCLERWRWQMSGKKKGRFTAEEDQKIMEAVKLYGENFAAICKVTGINRTPRHVSQHYHHRLNPATDRSPWTTEEMKQVYETCL
ncbi:hypothetical protein BDF20DRAFT_805681, partial [Mycotypha africana]|uniref:uncharacterized protein n=1 Tax=Mycotypha africana TaxID=64632 RepID=UPI0022FFED1B